MKIQIFENKIVVIALSVLGVVVILSIIGGLSGVLTDSTNVLNYPSNCTEGKDSAGKFLAINYSNLYCVNSTGYNLYTAKLYTLPFSSIISGAGLLILMALILVLMIIVIYKSSIKK